MKHNQPLVIGWLVMFYNDFPILLSYKFKIS